MGMIIDIGTDMYAWHQQELEHHQWLIENQYNQFYEYLGH
jgi:hypothetical protein